MLKKAKRTKATEDWEVYSKLKNKVTQEIRKAKLSYCGGYGV